MEQTTVDMVLVVCEREYPVNRKILVEGNSYFRAMLEGGFVEASLDRVQLTSICDPDAFAVVLDFILNTKVNLKAAAKVDWYSVLALSDMLNVYTLADVLKQELFRNWSDLEKVSSILQLAEALDVRVALLSRIFNVLKNTFIVKGKKRAGDILDLLKYYLLAVSSNDPVQSPETEDCCFSVIENFPGLILEFFGIEEAKFFRVPIFNDNYIYFVHGIASWVTGQKLEEKSIRDVVQCIVIQNMWEKSVMEILDRQSDFQQKGLFRKHLHYHFEKAKETLRSIMSCLLVGWPATVPSLYTFNLKKWKWELIELEMPSHGNTVYSSTWYTKCESFLSDSFIGASSNEPLYLSVQRRVCKYADSYQLEIFELDHENETFSIIFKTTVPKNIKGCSLCRQEDVIHGFATYDESHFNYTIVHFTLRKNCKDNTWFNSDFSLVPLLNNIRTGITPVATTMSKNGLLILFLLSGLDSEKLWLADFNLECGSLEPLGLLPVVPAKEYRAVGPLRKVDFNDTAKKICTMYQTCCEPTNIQVFYLSAVSRVVRNCFTCPFLPEFQLRPMNDHQVPRIMKSINLRASS